MNRLIEIHIDPRKNMNYSEGRFKSKYISHEGIAENQMKKLHFEVKRLRNDKV
jgi:hypothetical protein